MYECVVPFRNAIVTKLSEQSKPTSRSVRAAVRAEKLVGNSKCSLSWVALIQIPESAGSGQGVSDRNFSKQLLFSEVYSRSGRLCVSKEGTS